MIKIPCGGFYINEENLEIKDNVLNIKNDIILPKVTEDDNGMVLTVVEGEWNKATVNADGLADLVIHTKVIETYEDDEMTYEVVADVSPVEAENYSNILMVVELGSIYEDVFYASSTAIAQRAYGSLTFRCQFDGNADEEVPNMTIIVAPDENTYDAWAATVYQNGGDGLALRYAFECSTDAWGTTSDPGVGTLVIRDLTDDSEITVEEFWERIEEADHLFVELKETDIGASSYLDLYRNNTYYSGEIAFVSWRGSGSGVNACYAELGIDSSFVTANISKGLLGDDLNVQYCVFTNRPIG